MLVSQREITLWRGQTTTDRPLSRYGMALCSDKRSVWTMSPETSALRAMALIAVLHMLSRHHEGLLRFIYS